MAYYVVWVDHANAKVFTMGAERKSLKLSWTHPGHHTHGDASDHVSQLFYHSIATAIADADEVLVVGPGTAKNQLQHHLEKHDQALAKRVVAYHTADHPSDGQLLADARRFFRDPLHAAR